MEFGLDAGTVELAAAQGQARGGRSREVRLKAPVGVRAHASSSRQTEDVGALLEISTAVWTLAAEVKEVEAERGFPAPAQDPRLFRDFQDLSEPLDAIELLRRARAAAGGPLANLGDRQRRRATDGTIPTGGGAGRPPEPPATTPSRCWRS